MPNIIQGVGAKCYVWLPSSRVCMCTFHIYFASKS